MSKRFLVWQSLHSSEDDEGDSVTAASHADAAERWAAEDDWNSAEFAIIGGRHATVGVRLADDESDPWQWFTVKGVPTPTYRARPADTPWDAPAINRN